MYHLGAYAQMVGNEHNTFIKRILLNEFQDFHLQLNDDGDTDRSSKRQDSSPTSGGDIPEDILGPIYRSLSADE
jgi:hypothetical protein